MSGASFEKIDEVVEKSFLLLPLVEVWGVEVRGEGATVGVRVDWDSQRVTRFNICGDMPGFLLAVWCVCVCVCVCDCVIPGKSSLQNTHFPTIGQCTFLLGVAEPWALHIHVAERPQQTMNDHTVLQQVVSHSPHAHVFGEPWGDGGLYPLGWVFGLLS